MGFKVISILLLTLTITEIHGSLFRSSFGEGCNKTHRCDSRSWLGCFDGVCDCVKQDEMHFDLTTMKCVSKVGERCKFSLIESDSNSAYEKTECVAHAECNSDGYCECDAKYHEIFNGTCALSGLHGEHCSEIDKCSSCESLDCVDGTCKCTTDSEFSIGLKKCVGLAGKLCVNSNCISSATCADDKCVCQPDYYHNKTDNRCYETKGVFKKCTDTSECKRKTGLMLECLEGVCNCGSKLKYGKVQKIEAYCPGIDDRYCGGHYGSTNYAWRFSGEFASRCAPVLDERCPDGFCMENAKCAFDEYKVIQSSRRTKPILSEYGTCKCLSDTFVGNSDKTNCLTKYGSNCQYTKECVGDLVCDDGKCSCPMPDHQYVSTTKNSCITIVGARCSKDSNCVPDAFCDLTVGQCKCDTGFVVSDDKKCETAFGRKCSSSVPCDSVAGLHCVDNRCSCRDQMYSFSTKLRQCIGSVGAKCNADLENSRRRRECTESAECVREHPKLSGECRCVNGYEQTENLTCRSSILIAENTTITSEASIIL